MRRQDKDLNRREYLTKKSRKKRPQLPDYANGHVPRGRRPGRYSLP